MALHQDWVSNVNEARFRVEWLNQASGYDALWIEYETGTGMDTEYRNIVGATTREGAKALEDFARHELGLNFVRMPATRIVEKA